ncbi:cyclin-domain-containing protein [Lipomyces japonicus]|uniref:cyclin-domain-containing protein n=1 Tax=Lipomyces japonicus TaxID=56871 RepID=UPI0034CDA663
MSSAHGRPPPPYTATTTATVAMARKPEPLSSLSSSSSSAHTTGTSPTSSSASSGPSPSSASSSSTTTTTTTTINTPAHLDILNHSVADVLMMISALLQRIIEANDALYASSSSSSNLHLHHHHNHNHNHNHHHQQQLQQQLQQHQQHQHHQHHQHSQTHHRSSQSPAPAARPALSSSILAFHGRNVPAIALHAYLMRILKYCPATNEVFLSLLVYFDRMSKRANAGDLTTTTTAAAAAGGHASDSGNHKQVDHDVPVEYDNRNVGHEESDNNSSDGGGSSSSSSISEDENDAPGTTPACVSTTYSQSQPRPLREQDDRLQHGHDQPGDPHASRSRRRSDMADTFVMDSFNIHRLVIAGVTVASKFFSDVFYKNSRYAKVGGLPLEELNHLELQFLILVDFRLAIPLEELQRYGDLLLQFWQREQEVLQQQQQQQQ